VTDADSQAVERRLEYFLLACGALMTAIAAIGWGIRSGEGAALGTAMCWLNFRWLKQGAAAVIRLGMAQAGAEAVRVPRILHAKFFGRLVLLLVVVYATLVWLRLPPIATLCGLVAVFPAVVLELFYEVWRGHHRWNEQ
jgi:ATP synthase I subunit